MTAPNGTGVINRGQDFSDGDQVTAAKLQNIADKAVLNTNAIDNATVGLDGSGKLFVKDDGVVTSKILNSNVTLAKIANIADDRVLGNISGGSAAPSELTAAQLVTLLGTNLINPTTIDNNTNTITFSNGLIVKFGTHTTSGSSTTQTLNFSDHGGNFSNHIYSIQLICTTALSSTNAISINSQSASAVEFKAHRVTNGDTYSFIAIGR